AGRKLLHGSWDPRDIPIGKGHPLGHVSTALDTLPAPGRYRLVVGLEGGSIENDWNFWVYPSPDGIADDASVLVTSDWAEASESLASGGEVLFAPGNDDLAPLLSPPMERVPIFWNIQMTVRPRNNPHPRF